MKIRVKKKEKLYGQVHHHLVFHPKVSLQAKGLGALFECYSDDFEVSMSSLEIHTGLHRDTIRKYLKELEKYFFLFRVQVIRNCKMIWFFDSENLEINFLVGEIEKIQKDHKIRFITAYEIFAPEKTGTEKLATYNNTINSTPDLSNLDYFQIMYQLQQENKLKGKNSEFYTSLDGNKRRKQLVNSPRAIKQDEIEF